jgi:hypothetical protein
MVPDAKSDQELAEALAAKKAAQELAHLQGFGGNRFPNTKREMTEASAKRGLESLALAAMGKK